jgi:hypothetical protein
MCPPKRKNEMGFRQKVAFRNRVTLSLCRVVVNAFAEKMNKYLDNATKNRKNNIK